MYSASSSRSRRPSSQQSLIDEVAFLHSLWHQGPPRKRRRGEDPPAESSKKPRTEQPQPQPQEKKKRKRKKKKSKKKKEEEEDGQQKPEGSGVPKDENWKPDSHWDTDNPSISKEWASEAIKTEVKPMTEEEQLQFAQLKVQHKAARVFREFLNGGREDESLPSSSEDDDEVYEEEDGDGENDDNGGRPSGALAKELDAQKAFEKMFDEDEELKRFYEQNCNCGSFECLVCAAIGEKMGKKFPDCVSLVQHAMKILKTKNKAAHRGYGRAVCCVLGWNVDRLPSVAKPLSSDLQPRACIPPPDEDKFQGQAPEEGDNGKEIGSGSEDDNDAKDEMDSDGEKEASDDNDAKDEMDSDGENEVSDDNDAKHEMDSDGEKEVSADNDAKNDQDKEPALD